MKKEILKRVICALLALSTLTTCISCVNTTTPEPEYKEDIKLDVIVESITYSDEFIENANVRFAKIACSMVESYLGVALDNKQKQSISSEFKKTIIPIAYRVRIYEEELDALLTSFENYIESEDNDFSALDLYDRCLYEIGSERSGKLAYEISLEFVERKKKDAKDKYDEYEYDWYLDDAERCAALLVSLEEMGEEKFVSIISMLSFLTSLTKSSSRDKESAFELSSADLLCIMDYQGELFESSQLTEDDFSVFGALIQEIIPKKGNGLSSEMLYVLKNNEYFPTSFRCIPKIILLYADIAKALNDDGSLDVNGDSDDCARTIARAMLASESSLVELDIALKRYAVSTSASEKDVIDSFLNEEGATPKEIEPIEFEELVGQLHEISKVSSELPYEKLQSSLSSYLYAIAPYITLAFFILK